MSPTSYHAAPPRIISVTEQSDGVKLRKMVESNRARKAVVFQLDLPLQTLKPGFYTCQVNIIDDVSGNYAFPRWAMMIKDAPAASPSAGNSGNRN